METLEVPRTRQRSFSLPSYSTDGGTSTSDDDESFTAEAIDFQRSLGTIMEEGGAEMMDSANFEDQGFGDNMINQGHMHSPLPSPHSPHLDIKQEDVQRPRMRWNFQGLYQELREDTMRFSVAYQAHLNAVFDAAGALRVDGLRDEIMSFWPKARRYFSLFQNPLILHQILDFDTIFYKELLYILLPDPFHYNLPPERSAVAIEISRLFPVWLHNAIQFAVPLAFSEDKIKLAKHFCITLHKQAIICNLGARLAQYLNFVQNSGQQSGEQWGRMYKDWQQIDFEFINQTMIVDQAGMLKSGAPTPIENLEDITKLLKSRAGIETWSEWLYKSVLGGIHQDDIHQWVLQWSFFMSTVLSELTLLQAKSLPQFRLLFGWIEAVLCHHMELQWNKVDPRNPARPSGTANADAMSAAPRTGFWRQQTVQLKQQIEFLTEKIVLLEQQLASTRIHSPQLSPHSPPYPVSPRGSFAPPSPQPAGVFQQPHPASPQHPSYAQSSATASGGTASLYPHHAHAHSHSTPHMHTSGGYPPSSSSASLTGFSGPTSSPQQGYISPLSPQSSPTSPRRQHYPGHPNHHHHSQQQQQQHYHHHPQLSPRSSLQTSQEYDAVSSITTSANSSGSASPTMLRPPKIDLSIFDDNGSITPVSLDEDTEDDDDENNYHHHSNYYNIKNNNNTNDSIVDDDLHQYHTYDAVPRSPTMTGTRARTRSRMRRTRSSSQPPPQIKVEESTLFMGEYARTLAGSSSTQSHGASMPASPQHSPQPGSPRGSSLTPPSSLGHTPHSSNNNSIATNYTNNSPPSTASTLSLPQPRIEWGAPLPSNDSGAGSIDEASLFMDLEQELFSNNSGIVDVDNQHSLSSQIPLPPVPQHPHFQQQQQKTASSTQFSLEPPRTRPRSHSNPLDFWGRTGGL